MRPRKYFIHFSDGPRGRTLHFHVPWAHYYRDAVGPNEEIMGSKTKYSEQMTRNERSLFFQQLHSHLLQAMIEVKLNSDSRITAEKISESVPSQFLYKYGLRKTEISIPLPDFFESLTLEHLKKALLPKLPSNVQLLARKPSS